MSCWDYGFAPFLQGYPWIKISDAEIAETVLHAQHEHRTALEALIKASGISCARHIHHLRCDAGVKVPDFVKQEKIDILVMRTVGRNGIPGFMIGNTAENIVKKRTCSLMAPKPQGYISPVKAY